MVFAFAAGFFLAWIVSFGLTRFVRDTAISRVLIPQPRSERDIHTRLVPRLGGIAIVLAVIIGVAAFAASNWFLGNGQVVGLKETCSLLAPTTLIFLIGLLDDLYGLGPVTKLLVEGGAALWFAMGYGVHLTDPLRLLISVFWVVSVTNAFNLIDGIDGLAAGSGIFPALFLLLFSLRSENNLNAAVAVVFVGALLGFLRFNFPPATIFLGDGGSLTIGFLISALSVETIRTASKATVFAAPIIALGYPLTELAWSATRRFLSGRPLAVGDREHIHHKLLDRGLSVRKVMCILYGVSAYFLITAYSLLHSSNASAVLMLAVAIAAFPILLRVGYVEPKEFLRVLHRITQQKRIFANNIRIRRAMTQLRRVSDFDDICKVVLRAFEQNDFQGLELRVRVFPGELVSTDEHFTADNDLQFHWTRHEHKGSRDELGGCHLDLDLIARNGLPRGALVLFLRYSQPYLWLDINLLTVEFPKLLADALNRACRQHTGLSAAPLAWHRVRS